MNDLVTIPTPWFCLGVVVLILLWCATLFLAFVMGAEDEALKWELLMGKVGKQLEKGGGYRG
jgi:hypothetical protein